MMRYLWYFFRCSWLKCNRNFDPWRRCMHCGLTRAETPKGRRERRRALKEAAKDLEAQYRAPRPELPPARVVKR